jgi:putative transposase
LYGYQNIGIRYLQIHIVRAKRQLSKKFGYDIDIVELEVPENHIHMVVQGVPKMSPSSVMQVVKSISAREFFRIYPEVKRCHFWGGKLWTQSYIVETIGNANEEVIIAYVQNQLLEYDKKESRSSQLSLF